MSFARVDSSPIGPAICFIVHLILSIWPSSLSSMTASTALLLATLARAPSPLVAAGASGLAPSDPVSEPAVSGAASEALSRETNFFSLCELSAAVRPLRRLACLGRCAFASLYVAPPCLPNST